ncbi:MAG: hypothetical protein ACAI44_29970 [Candidatus Sericytochromatia bacterium]
MSQTRYTFNPDEYHLFESALAAARDPLDRQILSSVRRVDTQRLNQEFSHLLREGRH